MRDALEPLPIPDEGEGIARPEPGAEGLDVERLAEVLSGTVFAQWLLILCTANIEEGQRLNPDFARDIAHTMAREYAALAVTEPKP
jgi:hypothetical protein